MTMRETVYALLSTDSELIALGINDTTVYNIEAPDNPDRQTPFIVTAWANSSPRAAIRGPRDMLVWAHDHGGDYTRIDAILSRVQELLVAIVHQGGISQIAWTGDSSDLYDDGFRTITRNSGFRVNSGMEN